ncbi:29224_t:CDS:2 [Gigaspora margarita]|uniref:29224_t:CDS:1 n=1 Tax=Gigaspora margarita TaxID=4874 RepID=A0ABN7VAL9_GIGMA|nr:29224_t:CDS:2 [Gigaspora margarita]
MPEKEKPALPKGLEYKRAITDYLTEIDIINKLIKKTAATHWPNVNFMKQVLLIMTVLAEFSEQANASIRECAYKAGLILTQYADTLQLTMNMSSYSLFYAAIIYCMRTLKEHIITEDSIGDSAVNLLYENYYSQLQYMVQEFCRHVKLPFTGIRKDFKTYELDIKEVCPVLKQYVTRTSKVKLEKDDWIINLEYEDVKNIFDLVFSWQV